MQEKYIQDHTRKYTKDHRPSIVYKSMIKANQCLVCGREGCARGWEYILWIRFWGAWEVYLYPVSPPRIIPQVRSLFNTERRWGKYSILRRRREYWGRVRGRVPYRGEYSLLRGSRLHRYLLNTSSPGYGIIPLWRIWYAYGEQHSLAGDLQ